MKLERCGICGVPLIECLKKFSCGQMRMICSGLYISNVLCDDCLQEACIHCSHCDEIIPDKELLKESLDDGSYLCKLCGIKLQDELDTIIHSVD